MFFPVSAWFLAFVLTVVVEMPVVWLLARGQEHDPRRLAILVVFANLATHPAVWFVFTQVLLVGTVEYTLASEAWAVLAETLFYAVTLPISARRAVVIGVVANVASFAVGSIAMAIAPEAFR